MLRPAVEYFQNIVKFFAGMTLAWSGWVHEMNPYYFASVIDKYELLPRSFGVTVAVGLPALQLVTGILLLFGSYAEAASLVATFLFGVFVFVQSFALATGKSISCGCFGVGSHDVSYLSVSAVAVMFLGLLSQQLLPSRESRSRNLANVSASSGG